MKNFNKFNRFKRGSVHALGFIFLSGLAYGQSLNFTEVTTPFTKVSDGSVTFADVDGDGDQDVLLTGIATGGPNTSLYLNDGTGNYTFKETGLPGVYFGTAKFADFDSDGDLDLILTGVDVNDMASAFLFLNDGNANFTQVSDAPFIGVGASSATVADVDGNGSIDILLAGMNNDNEVITRLYLNDGTAGFTMVSNSSITDVWFSGIEFADIDSDGDQDLLIVGENEGNKYAELYKNDGSGNFSLVSGTPFVGLGAASVAFGDLNGDGHLDVVTNGYDSMDNVWAKLFINDGAGNFTEDASNPFAGTYDGSVSLADVDGDGHLDVLLTGGDSGFSPLTKIYLNDGSGVFASATHPFANVMYSDSAFADIDNDGKMDVLILGVNNNNQRVTSLFKNQETMSTADLHSNSVHIYPNPSRGIFNLKAEKSFEQAQLVVTAVSGQTVFSKKVSGDMIQIDLSNSPAGVYFVRINGQDYKLIKK